MKYGKNSRIDLLLSGPDRPDCYVEIKNVHLLRTAGLAEFPDSVTKRGAKHLVELSDMVAEGSRAVMVYLVQRDDARQFGLARDIDPGYGEAFDAARQAGVEMICYSCGFPPRRSPLPIPFRYWSDAVSPSLGYQPLFAGLRGGLATGSRVEFAQDRRDMVVDGLRRDKKLLGDLGVGKAFGEEAQHVHLAAGQASGIALRRLARFGRREALGPHGFAQGSRGTVRAEAPEDDKRLAVGRIIAL